MKKKYLLMSIVGLFMFFGFMLNLKAAGIVCKYKSSSENLNYEFEISLTRFKRGRRSGNINNDETVRNWDSKYGEYQGNQKIECPKYAFILRTGPFGAYDVYVSDEDKKSKVEEKLNNEWWRWDGYPKTLTLLKQEDKEEQETPTSCLDFTKDGNTINGITGTCENNKYFACVWNKTGVDKNGNELGYCNTDKLQYVKCGGAHDIPHELPRIISFLINLLKIGTPIILIIVSTITLFKALAASKEDEIKKAQSSLIKKVIAAAMVFFVVTIVQFVITLVADEAESGSLSSCLNCFINNECENTLYYKTNVGGTNICTYLDSKYVGNECE